MRMGMVRTQPLVLRRPEQNANMRPFVNYALYDFIGAADIQPDRDPRVRLHERTQAFLHQPVDVTLPGHDVDMAALDLANTVDPRK